MLDPNGRHRFETERPRRLDATMAGDDHLRLVDEDRICKTKFANRGRDLVDLLLRVNARVVRKDFNRSTGRSSMRRSLNLAIDMGVAMVESRGTIPPRRGFRQL
jgi:hypothetical protein